MKSTLPPLALPYRAAVEKDSSARTVLEALSTAVARVLLLVCALGLTLLVGTPAHAQDATGAIAGSVVDSTSGQSLPGVNIQIVGTQRGTSTNINGDYTISDIEPGEYDLQASFVGYLTQTIEGVVVRPSETTELNFQLAESLIEMDEVVAIGYGTTQRSELTGSVVSVDQEELTEVPVTSVIETLQGEVAGLDITNQSGETGAGLNFTIRGNRSLTASNSPLFIVDGVQYGNINNLNPNDIASVEVLKDAASTAIYGARGANGVVLITTKEGTPGETQVDVNSYVGVTQSAGFPPFNNAEQYLQLRREAHRTTGAWSSPEDDENIGLSPQQLENYRNGVATDYRDLLIRDGLQQSHQIGVSTGTENTQAYLSAGYLQEDGIVAMDQLQRYTLRMNLSHEINDVIEVGTNTQLTYTDQDRRDDPLNLANKIIPLTSAYNDDGTLNLYPTDRDISPLADEQPNAYANNTKHTDLAPTLFVELSPTDHLTFRSDAALGLDFSRQGIFRSSATIDRNGSAPEARYLTSNSRSIDLENVLTYDNDFGAHSVQLTGVVSYLGSQTDFGSELGQGQLLASQLYYGLRNAPDGIAIESGYEETGLLSYAGRLNYGWQDRYLLTLTGRADGSSRLSEGNKWAFFPSIAGAWRIIEEPFMDRQSLFSDLKLRASYGISGNDAVVPYATQAVLTRIPFGFGESSAPGYAFSDRIGNPNLEWEMSRTVNFGLDFALWNNRIIATADVYDTHTSNLLLERFLPETSGVSSVVQNVGETRNRGLELSLKTQNIVRDDFLWQSDLTFFTNREEILELTGEGDDVANGWFIGHPTSAFFDYEKVGIWQQDEANQAAQFGQEPGEIRVHDQDGDGAITPADRVVLGAATPDWSGSLQNRVYAGSFDFTAVIYARVGQMMQYEYYNSFKPDGVENGAAVDYWTPENPTDAFPRPHAQYSKENYQYFSSLTYEDGSFVKLRNVTVGYTLPQSLSSRLSVDKLRIYLSGKNLWTLSGVEDYDPERGGGLSFPMTRLFVGGIDVGF